MTFLVSRAMSVLSSTHTKALVADGASWRGDGARTDVRNRKASEHGGAMNFRRQPALRHGRFTQADRMLGSFAGIRRCFSSGICTRFALYRSSACDGRKATRPLGPSGLASGADPARPFPAAASGLVPRGASPATGTARAYARFGACEVESGRRASETVASRCGIWDRCAGVRRTDRCSRPRYGEDERVVYSPTFSVTRSLASSNRPFS